MESAAQGPPVLLVGYLASFLFWAGLVSFLFVVFGFLPYVKKIPPARFYSPMVLTSPYAFVIGMGGFSTYFVQTTAANIVMFSVIGLGWWYAYGGVHFWLKGFKVIEKSQIGKNGFSELMFASATEVAPLF